MNPPVEETHKWHYFYDKLLQFQETYGHCNIPMDEGEHEELIKWMLIQKKAKHRLSPHLLNKLKPLEYESCESLYWYEQFEALEKFFGKHGHAHVPSTDPQYAQLHDWLIVQIKSKDSLSERQKDKLDSFGIYWEFNTLREWKWHEMYLQLKAFYQEHGHCNVPQKWSGNPRLGHWVTVQRRSFAQKSLKKERKHKLDAMGFVWDFRKVYEGHWEKRFDQLENFKKEHGHCKVPLTYANRQLAGWVDRQRTLKTKGKLSASREQKLEKIGFIWNCDVLQEESWQKRFDELKKYKKQFGDCQVPLNWQENPSLGTWVRTQRTLEKRGKLDEKKRKKLNALGFAWVHEAWQLQLKKYDQQWEKNFLKFQDYKKKHGEVQVSVSIDPALERWTCIQRKKRQIGKLSEAKIEKLDKVGFPWDIHESYWMRMYDQLVRFKAQYGHTRVPYQWPRNRRLGQWVSRTRRKQYTLTETQISLLNKIDFDWRTIRKKAVPWREMLERLIAFKNRYGHARVPLKWNEDRKLGKWVSRMRYDKNKLNPERKKMLEAAGLNWKVGKGRPKNGDRIRKSIPFAEIPRTKSYDSSL